MPGREDGIRGKGQGTGTDRAGAEPLSQLACVLTVIAFFIVYAMVFTLFHDVLGPHTITFAMLPAAFAALLLGLRGGLIVGAGTFPLNILLLYLTHYDPYSYWEYSVSCSTVIVVICILIGHLRDLTEEIGHHRDHLEELVEERTSELKEANEELKKEVDERKRAEEGLRRHRDHLEERVEERASELKGTNEELEREVAERRRAEAYLRESRELYLSIAENTKDGLAVIRGGRTVYINDRACEILGYPKEELAELGRLGMAAPEERVRLRGFMRRARRKGAPPEELELWIVRKDGTRRCILCRYSTIDSGDPKGGYLVVVTDVTERKKAEEAVNESERKFRSIIESLPLGVHMYKLDPDGTLRFIGANPAADRILGVEHSQYIGKTIDEAFPNLVETDIPARFAEIAKKGGFWHKENIIYEDELIGGALENFNFQTSPGTMVSLFQDITERKLAEEELERHAKHLEKEARRRNSESE